MTTNILLQIIQNFSTIKYSYYLFAYKKLICLILSDQDSGKCPICGKMLHWKLLNHVAKEHLKTLKPANLVYMCTVCTSKFGQYKLFEIHVHSAHRG